MWSPTLLFDRRAHSPENFVFSNPKRVLQHYQGKSGRSSDIAFRSRLTQSCHQNARWEGCACSITSICLERKKGAEPQEDDGSCNDRAGDLANSGGNRGEAGGKSIRARPPRTNSQPRTVTSTGHPFVQRL